MTRPMKALIGALCLGYLGLVPEVRRTVYRGLYLLAVGHLGQFHEFLLSLGPWAPLVSVALMYFVHRQVPEKPAH